MVTKRKEVLEKCIAVLTSGGDAPGMNAAVRAVVRTALHYGVKVFAIHEGYQGLVNGGKFIEEATWDYVGGIIDKGGTKIGTTRSKEFESEAGRLKAARNLILNGIDRLVVIGGDGSLTGANIFYNEWPGLVEKLVRGNSISRREADRHPQLAVVGMVGSIDNDMYGTDFTIGADTALHRISEAVDAISSTAASHQRIFVVEVMGRHCGYLALMGALITGADWVFIPESPASNQDWKSRMIEDLKAGMKAKRAIIVMLAEGAIDITGAAITSNDVKKALEEGLRREDETRADVRVTILGHVQRGGSPSAFDRNQSTRLGDAAVEKMLTDDAFSHPCILGMKGEHIVQLPLVETIASNREITAAMGAKDFKKAMTMRGEFFEQAYEIACTLMKPEVMITRRHKPPLLAILHSGSPAPGMNTAVRAATRLAIASGFGIMGVERGFDGLINGNFRPLDWTDVNGWASMGGAELGTSRDYPGDQDFIHISKSLERYNIKGMLMIGGWSGYEGSLAIYNKRNIFPAFNIPIVCIPATISNNLPGTDVSVGSDTAINSIVNAVDKIKQSAVAARRCFVVEVSGRYCGYLALMSGLATGAERVYMPEEKITLKSLQDDLKWLLKGFKKDRRVALMIRNEMSYRSYNTTFMTSLFNEESQGFFESRQAILGHLQHGGNPSPLDRILATRFADESIKYLTREVRKSEPGCAFIGLMHGKTHFSDLSLFFQMVDREHLRAKDPWWLDVRPIASFLSFEPK